jgi:preprotein translocase subunit SecA
MDWDQISDKFSGIGDAFGRSLKRVFGSANERAVSKLDPIVVKINELEGWAEGLTAEQFHEQTANWKAALAEGEIELDSILPEAFALVREASKRTLGLRHYDVQLVGGMILHEGSIAEMSTGEGKTLVATLPLYLNALTGKHCFLVTVNDYLARRDAEWMGPIYDYLGVSWGSIQSSMDPGARHPMYARDIIYATNNELGFDYLRDNMKTRLEDQVQRDLYFAIVDEVDSILIDEARTPLIISGPAELMPDKYVKADQVAQKLVEDEHFEVKEKERQVSLLEEGIVEAQTLLGVESFYSSGAMDWPHYLENALRARNLYERDREYVVEEGEVVIVDEFTGRKMPGRRWSDGLHQAVEVSEGLKIRNENQTLATITFQNYFRLYEKLAGMTGTAMTEAGEFFKIYGMETVAVPTNRPIARDDCADLVYRTEPEKWKAIVDEIERVNKGRATDDGDDVESVDPGQPVLVGTTSVENSEKLAKLLKQRGVPHEVLNAKNHEREASIVACAGERGAVTVSTNMAGRGTDIKLGGNFEYRMGLALEEAGLKLGDPEHLEEIDRIREEVRARLAETEQEVLGLGGLYVLGTERHEARRIDNQLRGRSGRQGDAGQSRFFLSLEDPLMRRFYRDWVKNFMEKLGMTEGQAIESPMVSRAIKKAQKKVEDYYFEIRKNLLEYDEVMDEQRKTIYSVRQQALEGVNVRDKIHEMIEAAIGRAGVTFADDAEGFAGWFQRMFGFELDEAIAARATEPKDNDVRPVMELVVARYAEREGELDKLARDNAPPGVDPDSKPDGDVMRQIERYLLLRIIDSRWKDHLHAIDALKAGIGLRGYAQRDPKSEYKQEGFELFQRLLEAVEDEMASLILRVEVGGPPPQAQQQMGRPVRPGGPGGAARPAQRPPQRLPATMAFDAKRQMDARRAAMAQAQAVAAQQEAAKQGGGTAAPASPGTQPGTQPGTKPATAQPAAPEQAAAQQAGGAPTSIGRNDPCPCGSGRKFKKCHGRDK